ncbi:hypothetical protein HH214_10445 [Mucilaginibacter robiniae]|uniref:ABC-three component systems C-terminal domain-containing protein n=1 Tax=Mucilaginibacter robiniae TaxID=2728022 RepID=A0A7L5DYP6_9SPHI|nr:ABC-three component system protein [Mucilaginibacter robiniae]QJD96252.1 hypothetical protein HH214_10445 [Mucilaginibacter robiniae]
MANNAPGQLLGFSLQYPRALWHLLNCSQDHKVCLEVIGDVGVLQPDNGVVSEEDKSSQVSNPVTDKSIDLWKTLSNWVKAVIEGEIDADKTKFLLYTNKKGRKGIVDSFHAAKDIASAKTAVHAAWKNLAKIKSDHEIHKYIEFLKSNEDILSDIVSNFEFQIGSSNGSEEVRKAIRAKHVSDSQVEYIEHALLGWLHTNVTKKLSNKEDAIVSWNEFDAYASVVFGSARRRELIDFTLQYPLEHSDVKKQKLERPPYIRQLEAIKGDDDDIQQAVTDFLKAKVNRFKWIEQELIDEPAAREFEEKLTDYWKSQKKMVNITHPGLGEEEKGQLVYNQCRIRQQVIKNQDPPPATIAGTYHLMSNSFTIGWHPKWEESFINNKSQENE